jgi:hypothetical protein
VPLACPTINSSEITERVLEIGPKMLSRAQADRYLSAIRKHPRFGAKAIGSICLRTVWELKKLFDQPEQFLMIPGHELNRGIVVCRSP